MAPPLLASHLIYHFKCPSCNAGYIGETRMHFKVRCSQHLGISEWTEKPRKGGVPTSITKHIKENNCLCSYDNFSIIGFENDYHRRLLKESLFIKLHDYEWSTNFHQAFTIFLMSLLLSPFLYFFYLIICL